MSTCQFTPLKRTAATLPSFTPARSGLLQRKCACGGTPGPTGECEECNKKKRLGLQAKLKVNTPGDIYEQEADRIADRVMATQTHPEVRVAPPLIQRFAGHSNGQVYAAPDSVNQTLVNPGTPLEPALRQDIEQRFGYDFSRVRVHTGPAAEQSATDLNASAYTLGSDIVFSAGQFEPGTDRGRRLLAHELTHVVQQRGGLRIQRKVGTAMPSGTTRAPTAEDRRDFAREAVQFLQGQGEHFALQPDRNLADQLSALATTARNALSVIQNDPGAVTLAEQVRAAYRAAVRTIFVARTRRRSGVAGTPPTLRELYAQNRDVLLPFGLAEADAAAGELSAELEAPLPPHATQAQRRRHDAVQRSRTRMQVLTSSVDFPIHDLFSTRGGTTTVPLPAHTTARFASTVPTTFQRGLQNVAGQLAQQHILTANTTITLALDLTEFGGSRDGYRFTWLDLGTNDEILIERQGIIGAERLNAQQRQRNQERFSRLGFRRTGFSQEEFDQVLVGLAEIPEGRLTQLGNLRFERAAADPAHPDAAGHYDQARHTVRLFDKAFSGGMTRFGEGGHLLTFAEHAVVHEVGHALDLSPLRTTAAATERAEEALLREFGTGGRGFRIPGSGDPERARFEQLNRPLTAAQQAEARARALSGARWSTGATATVTDVLPQAEHPAFRTAALADGGPSHQRRMPTNYPHPESVWQEYFAESFALYQSSPDVLRRIRPHVFEFMQRRFPR